jgi:RNAse (barnase) inhibitor barstar
MLHPADLNRVTCYCIHFVAPSEGKSVRQDVSGVRAADIDAAGVTDDASAFEALAAAMDFPSEHGRNWDAMDDMLTDMSWSPAPGYVLFVHNATLGWTQAGPSMGQLVESWLICAEKWSRTGVAFHLVFIW